jgi:hypothetical protein
MIRVTQDLSFNDLLEYLAMYCGPDMLEVFTGAKPNPEGTHTKISEVVEWVSQEGIYIAAEAGNIKMLGAFMELLKIHRNNGDYNTV